MKSLLATTIALASAVVSLAGCGRVPQPEFRQNMVALAEKGTSPTHQDQIGDILEALFGTPDDPYVLPEMGLDLQKIRKASGPVVSDATGAQRGLYREHCAHCHGVTGDGMGPTAAFLKPYPRDYRPGIYKFKSTPSNYEPTHDDLMRVVNHGITGTAMPSFKLLPKDDVEALVEYVKYLSLRGQTELALIDYAFQNLGSTEKIPTSHDVLVGEILKGPAGPVTKWDNAASQVSQIPEPPANLGTRESIEKGKQIFYGAGGCVKCHGPTALGDGQLVWDDWNEKVDLFLKDIPKLHAQLDKQEEETLAELDKEGITEDEEDRLNFKLDDLDDMRRRLAEADVAVLPPRQSEPRNLRQGIYRGGRERFEIFYRLQNGILASKMPAIPSETKPEDIWHVVDYVLALPYEPGSQYAPEVQASGRERL